MIRQIQQADKRIMVFLHDIFMSALAWVVANEVRYNLMPMPHDLVTYLISLLPFVCGIQGIAFLIFGLYRGIWRFASLPDFIRILKAVVLGFISLTSYGFLMQSHHVMPRSVPLLFSVFLLLFLSFGRILVRMIKFRQIQVGSFEAKRVLVIGNSLLYEGLVREILSSHEYKLVAIVDPDVSKHGREMHGVKIEGALDKIQEVAEKHQVDLVLIALSQFSAQEIKLITNECGLLNIPYRIAPNFNDTQKQVELLSAMRDVSVDDLLGRDPCDIHGSVFAASIAGKSVLVTGGGGSIGAEMCRQIARLKPSVLFIIDHSESNLYAIEMELKSSNPELPLVIKLISLLQAELLNLFFNENRPQLVFHAAAYKHVPLLEKQIKSAVENNVLGTKNVVDCAVKFGAEKCVFISTDKAVNPNNVMGMTKRAGELYCQLLSKAAKTKLIIVRFGNVLDSVGSVVPLFRDQIKAGGPVTVTHPDVTRFFMTISEASRLVLHAQSMGKGGEIFVLDMGKSVKIKELAEQMIRLSGRIPYKEVGIVYTGLREGEKLSEELFYADEKKLPTFHKKIYRSESVLLEVERMRGAFEYLFNVLNQVDEKLILAALSFLIRQAMFCAENKHEMSVDELVC